MNAEESSKLAKEQLARALSDKAWEKVQACDEHAAMATEALRQALGRKPMTYDDNGRLVHVPISDVLADADAILAWMTKATQ